MKKQLHKMWLLAICTLCAASSFAQSTPLKGRVVDEEGVAIIGATVFASQTNQGTVTDIDGSFSLNVAPKTVVNISFLGYETQSVELTQNVVVKMVSDSKELEEVVVIGYGSVRKKEVTGAVARVDSEDIMKITTSDLGNAIQGMVAGVSVTADSGAPGSASSVVIRGYSSISGDNTPLYVVDGVPQEDDPRISSNDTPEFEAKV
ncbi:MAG: carboxypeptidase-like regulatory domain-containing protein, partial [Rikenellaceae bacterium]